MPGPSRVLFFLVVLSSVRKEPSGIEFPSSHLSVVSREGSCHGLEPPQCHTMAFCHTLSPLSLPWELRLCASGMGSLQALCPALGTNIYWIGHQSALMEELDGASGTVQYSSVLVPYLATRGTGFLTGKTVKPSLSSQLNQDSGPTPEHPGAQTTNPG